MKKLRMLGLVCACLILAVSNANAITIDFEQGGATGGTIESDGTDVWSGDDIAMTDLKVLGAPENNGLYNIDSGFLSFDTRAGSNFIKLTGGVAALDIGDVNTILLEGSFADFTYNPGLIKVFQGEGPDVKNSELLAILGIAPGTPFNFFGFAIESSEGVVTSADIINTAVPVPTAVWLFGSGLIGLVGIARRKNSV